MIITVRETLTTNRTYYVRTDGNDSNNGLSNTAAGAFRTINHAFDVLDNTIDVAGWTVFIRVATGTYTENIFRSTAVNLGEVQLLGDTTTPSNVVLAPASGTVLQVTNGAALTLGGFKIVSPTTAAILVYDCGILTIQNPMDFGGGGIEAVRDGHIVFQSGYNISGGGTVHFYVDSWSSIGCVSAISVTITGTPNFSTTFALVGSGSLSFPSGSSFSGSATGKRYSVSANGVIDTNGAGATFLPGSTAGTATTGGQYV